MFRLMLSRLGEAFGRAATSSHGCIESASERAATQKIARMTQMRIRKPRACLAALGQFRKNWEQF